MSEDYRFMTTEQAEYTTGFGSLLEILMGLGNVGKIDEMEMGRHNGVRYMIRDLGSHYCAYIEVPYDLDTPHFMCPWGVTWGDYDTYLSPHTEWPDGTVVDDGKKVIGWDYNHGSIDSHHYTKEEVLDDIRTCIDSLEAKE